MPAIGAPYSALFVSLQPFYHEMDARRVWRVRKHLQSLSYGLARAVIEMEVLTEDRSHGGNRTCHDILYRAIRDTDEALQVVSTVAPIPVQQAPNGTYRMTSQASSVYRRVTSTGE
jgi:hypothetical protein